MKTQRLSEDKVQYLVYQILKGLKVSILIMQAHTPSQTNFHESPCVYSISMLLESFIG